jgi:hypothetical protein
MSPSTLFFFRIFRQGDKDSPYSLTGGEALLAQSVEMGHGVGDERIQHEERESMVVLQQPGEVGSIDAGNLRFRECLAGEGMNRPF